MRLTTEITQRLDRLDIAGNAPLSAYIPSESPSSNGPSSHTAIQPAVSENPPTPIQSHSLQQRSSTPSEHSTLEASASQDVDMTDDSQDTDITDDLVNRAANLSVERQQPMRLATLTARFRESSENRRRLKAIARQNAAQVTSSPTGPAQAPRSDSSSISPTLGRRPRRHPRPSLIASGHKANPFFRTRTQLHRAARIQRLQAALEARLSYELHIGDSFRTEAIFAQLQAEAAMVYSRGY